MYFLLRIISINDRDPWLRKVDPAEQELAKRRAVSIILLNVEPVLIILVSESIHLSIEV